MADDKTSDTGVWIDDETGKVVKKRPARGTQLVRPGGRITSAVQPRIDSLDADPDAEPVPAAVALGNPVEAAVDTDPVETAVSSDAAKPARRTRKSNK